MYNYSEPEDYPHNVYTYNLRLNEDEVSENYVSMTWSDQIKLNDSFNFSSK